MIGDAPYRLTVDRIDLLGDVGFAERPVEDSVPGRFSTRRFVTTVSDPARQVQVDFLVVSSGRRRDDAAPVVEAVDVFDGCLVSTSGPVLRSSKSAAASAVAVAFAVDLARERM